MATLKNTTINDDNYLILPVGTSAQRPVSADDGYMRFNSQFKSIEQNSNGLWKCIPPIAEDGLVLHLDASDPQSYPGSGLTWTDLSGVIGDVYVQNRNSDWSFVTDSDIGFNVLRNVNNRSQGNNPGINIPVNNGYNKLAGTLELWVKPEIDYTGALGWFTNSDGSNHTNASNWHWIGTWNNGELLYHRMGNSSTCCNDLNLGSFSSSWYPLNTWQHWTVTWNVIAGRVFFYKNGTFAASNTLPSNIPSSSPTNTGQMFNGHERADNMQFKGSCSVYKMYNRALSINEVQRNFNALRNRYGI